MSNETDVTYPHDGDTFTDAEHLDLERQRLQKQVDILNDDIATLRGLGRRVALSIDSSGELGELELIEADEPEFYSLLAHVKAGIDTLDGCRYLFAKNAAYLLAAMMETVDKENEVEVAAATLCMHVEDDAGLLLLSSDMLPKGLVERLERIAGRRREDIGPPD